MIVKPTIAIRNMPDMPRKLIRNFIRNVVSSGMCASDLGVEGSEEAIEYLFDIGFLKLRPDHECFNFKIFMYCYKRKNYFEITAIDLKIDKGSK